MSSDQAAEADALYMGVSPRIFAVIALVAMLLSRDRIRIALGAAPPRIIMGVFSRVFTQVGLGVLVRAFSAGLHGYARGRTRQP